jgi:hypothetical protein
MGSMGLRPVPGMLAVAAVVIAGSACGGPGTAPGTPGSSPGSAQCLGAQRPQCILGSASPVTVTVPSPRPASAPPWPERGMVLAEGNDPPLAFGSQVLDPAAEVLYALVPTTLTSPSAPDVLEAIDLRTGRVRRGESYQADGLALASGSLWVSVYSGPDGHPELAQASPATLATIRSVPLPGSSSLAWAVAAGPSGSVWAGAGRTLLRASASTGAVLARAILPAGLQLTALAVGPGGANLYAAALRLPPRYGAVVLEYSAGTGRIVAQSDGGTLKWSVGGASLTAVPGGVWVWFRTGMLGQSGLLSARSLSVAGGFPTAFSPADSPATGIGTIYDWAMSSSSAYSGGVLWVTTSPGLVACLNPVTGQVRAQEIVTSGQVLAVYALAADRTARQMVAVTSTTNNTSGVMTVMLETITPPRDCWG